MANKFYQKTEQFINGFKPDEDIWKLVVTRFRSNDAIVSRANELAKSMPDYGEHTEYKEAYDCLKKNIDSTLDIPERFIGKEKAMMIIASLYKNAILKAIAYGIMNKNDDWKWFFLAAMNLFVKSDKEGAREHKRNEGESL